MTPLVVFKLDALILALPLDRVLRTVRAVATTPLPQAPEIVCGVVNVQGRIVPVVNLRRRFGLPEREVGLSDCLLIARSATRIVAMIVDAVAGVSDCEGKDFVAIGRVVGGTRHLEGIVKGPDGMVLIHDLDSFLSLEETLALDAALAPLA